MKYQYESSFFRTSETILFAKAYSPTLSLVNTSMNVVHKNGGLEIRCHARITSVATTVRFCPVPMQLRLCAGISS